MAKAMRNSLNSKDLRGESWAGQYKAMLNELKKQGACAKVPKPPRAAGLIKS